MTDNEPSPGRRVRLEPTPPGFWRVLLGVIAALLAPLFGILIGSTVGTRDSVTGMEALYWGFLGGALVGGLGLVMAGLSALTLIRHARAGREAGNA
jgi:hypothetical protein